MQKYARKVILIIAALLLLLMTACGDQGRPEPAAQNSAPVVITAETETPKPESTAEPELTEAPAETAAPEQVETPEETTAPAQTETPAETASPELTEAPALTDEPEQPAVAQTPEPTAEPQVTQEPEDPNAITVEEDGEYTDKEHVALYIHLYGHLPSNYVTKEEARAAGWSPEAGNLITVLPGKSIGGDYFGNYEKLLPKAKGRKYYECDINFNPKGKTSGRVTRGGERIVYSNDGLIFYTGDHYNTYEQLY